MFLKYLTTEPFFEKESVIDKVSIIMGGKNVEHAAEKLGIALFP